MTKTIRASLLFAISLSALQALAFNPDKCGELFPKSGETHRPYLAPIYSSTIAPSVTSYFSSFGKCAMYNSKISIQRKKFIKASYDHLSTEAAQGQGEYVAALASLSGCPSESHAAFSHGLQRQYSQVFARGADGLDQQVDAMIQDDSWLALSCRQ
ncbi:MAG: DUF3015 family protein [Bdellovibrionales bacterium]